MISNFHQFFVFPEHMLPYFTKTIVDKLFTDCF